MRIRDPARGHFRHVYQLNARAGLGYRNWQGVDCGRLAHLKLHCRVGSDEAVEDGPQLGLVVGQGFVVDGASSGGEGDGVMVGSTDI